MISTELKENCIALHIKPGPKVFLMVLYFYIVTNNAYSSITNNLTLTPAPHFTPSQMNLLYVDG